ncbi:efflux transporter outer membrane subunit [Salinimicrobium oceani]|uniref:efflux transporter outer membrane subunit n=1 Tax=Salinimicrobium oceani TaxID=2722702 RepID=UPI00293BFC1C|nr:efflux transporter outer membrane subunit [Salinimicrobium oceani]
MLGVFVIYLLNSCTPKLSPVDLPLEKPAEFSITKGEVMPDNWWEEFDDPALDSLISLGLEENLLLSGNREAYFAALATVQREKSFLFPQLNGFAGASSRNPANQVSGDPDFNAGLTAAYELDLWGRVRAGIQAEKYTASAILQDYQSAAMSISAEIANTWFQLLTTRKQLELVDQQIKTNEEIVRLIRARFAGGQIRAVDILRQEQLLESTRNLKVTYETNLGIYKNQMAVLLGRPPQNVNLFPEEILPELPPLPAPGLPLELIRRRPDVQRDYLLLLAADRDMAYAMRSKLPVISLEATGQFRAGNFDNLFQNWAYTLAGNLLTPLFYGGRLSAEVKRTEAVKNQRLYEYGETILIAFQEVENALLQEQKQQERLEIMAKQLDLAQKTSKQLRIEFLNGMSNYLDVLLALDEQQQLERELLFARLEQLEIRVALYRSLAGGFKVPMENSL